MGFIVSDTINEDTVIRQVEKICISPEFRSKQLLCDFLSYIVSEYLAGRSDQLKGYTIGVDVFGKGEDFDPGEDALVRIHAGRLRRMLDLYYLKTGRADTVHIEVPKGNYTPVITLRYPDKTSFVKETERDPGRSCFEPGVILLPFGNLTGDPELNYFARGFSEELSLELTKFEELIVYDCTSCKMINENGINPVERWRKKGVRFMVEGSIMKASGEVKVLVKLIDIVNENQLWAERYTRQLTADHMNEIQESIAREVAHFLGSEYGIIFQKLSQDANRIKPKHIDTYTAVLKYYHFLAVQSPQTAAEAFDALERALKTEPDSPKAMALLSALLGNRYMLDQPDAEDAYVKMGELAEKAAIIDPNSSTVMAVLAFKTFVYDEKERFFNLTTRYLTMVRNNSAKGGSIAFHLALYGGWERAKLLLDHLMQTGQEYPRIFHGATTLYYYQKRQYELALFEANKYDLPSIFWGPLLRIAVYGQLGSHKNIAAEIAHLKKLKPEFESKARLLINRFIKEESLVEHVMEGLQKAGMSV